MQRIGNAGWISVAVIAALFVIVANASAQPANFSPQLGAIAGPNFFAGDPPALPADFSRGQQSFGSPADTAPTLQGAPQFNQQPYYDSPYTAPQNGFAQPQNGFAQPQGGCASGQCNGHGHGGQFNGSGQGYGQNYAQPTPHFSNVGRGCRHNHANQRPAHSLNYAAAQGGQGCAGGNCPFHGQHNYAPQY